MADTDFTFDLADLALALNYYIQQLPGYEQVSDGVEEVCSEDWPEARTYFSGAMDEVEVSVVTLNDGKVRLSFAVQVEDDYSLETPATWGVYWVFEETQLDLVDEELTLVSSFRSAGNPAELVTIEPLMRAIRMMDDITGHILFGDPVDFMQMEATYYCSLNDQLVADQDKSGEAKDFLRQFVYRVALADPDPTNSPPALN